MNGPMKDWDAMAADWREQAVPAIDVEALRAEAGQQGRRLRRMLVLETAFAALVVAFVAWIALRPGASTLDTWLFGGLGVFLVPYQAYVLWLRRREWSEAGLDVHALLDVELRRCATTLHYWRVGMWAAVGLWLLVFALLMVGIHAGWPDRDVGGLLGATLGNVVALPLIGLYGLRRSRLARERRERLLGLRAQLGEP